MNYKTILLCLLLVGCSNVSFNKNINAEPTEFNRYGMNWERGIKTTQ